MATTWPWLAAAAAAATRSRAWGSLSTAYTRPSRPYHLGQGHGDVAPAGAHVDAPPPLPQPEAIEGRHQRPAVDVVAEGELEHRRRRYAPAGGRPRARANRLDPGGGARVGRAPPARPSLAADPRPVGGAGQRDHDPADAGGPGRTPLPPVP